VCVGFLLEYSSTGNLRTSPQLQRWLDAANNSCKWRCDSKASGALSFQHVPQLLFRVLRVQRHTCSPSLQHAKRATIISSPLSIRLRREYRASLPDLGDSARDDWPVHSTPHNSVSSLRIPLLPPPRLLHLLFEHLIQTPSTLIFRLRPVHSCTTCRPLRILQHDNSSTACPRPATIPSSNLVKYPK